MAQPSFDAQIRAPRIHGVTDQVAQQLRAMIADGRLPQGAKLPEVPLAEALGVSRNTIRDSIRVLASEGLVVHAMNRGAMVRVLTPDDVSDIYALRRRFELEALSAVASADAEVQQSATKALEACSRALDRDDYGDFVEHELDFHAALVAHLGSPRLNRFFAQLIGELRLLFSDLGSDSEPVRANALLDMYRSVYASAQRGLVADAQRRLAEHLDTYEARLRELAGQRTATATGGAHARSA